MVKVRVLKTAEGETTSMLPVEVVILRAERNPTADFPLYQLLNGDASIRVVVLIPEIIVEHFIPHCTFPFATWLICLDYSQNPI